MLSNVVYVACTVHANLKSITLTTRRPRGPTPLWCNVICLASPPSSTNRQALSPAVFCQVCQPAVQPASRADRSHPYSQTGGMDDLATRGIALSRGEGVRARRAQRASVSCTQAVRGIGAPSDVPSLLKRCRRWGT